MINLVFLLDITGSMSNELAGVTATVRHLVTSVFEIDYAVMITIITFTESSQGCFVTNHSFTDGQEAIHFIKSIKLCVPPGHPKVSANGGDGDENQKAAIAELLTLDSTMPTIAFLITDAGPHLVDEPETCEAQHEINFLKLRHSIIDTDMFHVLALVQAHFQDKLILNIVKYIKNSDHRLYGSIAKKFDGVLIEPKMRDARRLANGLLMILSNMFDRCTGGSFAAASDNPVDEAALDTFIFYNLEGFSVPTCEKDVINNSFPEAGNTRDVLFAFLDRATIVIGDCFAKRAISASGLQEQVELLITIAQCLLGKLAYSDALNRAIALVDKILELMPEDNRGHLKLTKATLPHVLQLEICSTSPLEPSISAITLLTTLEAADDVLRKEDVFDSDTIVQTAASLFFAHLAVLELPKKNGKPDFMDAWSAVITKISPDVMTAKDFLTLIGNEKAIAGLSIRARDYNYAQLIADPEDVLGSALLRAASGTQVLDILTGLLSGAPAGLFCPNMFRGTVSASLMALLERQDEPLSGWQWNVAAKLVHSIRLVMGSVDQMPVDPEAATGKLLFRLLRHSTEKCDNDAVVAVLKELLATRVHKFIRFHEVSYLDLVERMVEYTHESIVQDAYEAHALDQDTWQFDAEKAQKFAAESSFYRAFETCAKNVIRCVFISPAKYQDETQVAPTLQDLWPTCTEEVPKFLLLQKRSARYCIIREEGATDGRITWELNTSLDEDLGSATYSSLAMQILRKKYSVFLKELRERRANASAEKRWSQALKVARVESMDAFIAKLSQVRDDSRREHKLLWKALKVLGSNGLEVAHYEDKLQVLITGRLRNSQGMYEIVFNRGNLHPHPDKKAPMSPSFQSKLRALRREHNWPLHHTYRDSKPNHNGHSNEKPSNWAKKRTDAAQTFWEVD